MASGWSCWLLTFCQILQLVLQTDAVDSIIIVREEDSFNVSCSYAIPGYWTIHPLLVNTQGQGYCTDLISSTSYSCYVYHAKPADSGTYIIEVLLTGQGVPAYQCSVTVIIDPIQTEDSSSVLHIMTSQSKSLTLTTSSTSLHTGSTLVSTSARPTQTLNTTTTTVVIATTAGPTSRITTIVAIIVPIALVGLLFSLSLIVVTVVVLFVMRSRRKGQLDEASDTGFLLGKERIDLYDVASDETPSQTIPFTSILFQELVSKSGSSLIHHASIKQRDVLVKQLKDEHGRDELLHEISLLRDLTDEGNIHHNIISLVGITVPPDPLCLIMEYLPHGSLHEFLLALQKGPIPNWYFEYVTNSPRGLYSNKQVSEDLFSILLQVAEGAQHLADHRLIHGHLSTSNVLIGRHLEAKLSNFTVSESGDYFVKTEREKFLQDLAPEVISQGEHSIKSDIWSFGILIYKVATFESQELFKKIRSRTIHAHILQGMRPPPLPCFSKELYFQMQQCWKVNKEERPDFKQLLHTLVILSQSSWSHLLFEISEKRKGYISESHQIYLFPPPPSHLSTSRKHSHLISSRRKVHAPRSDSSFYDDNTSGVVTSVISLDISSDTDHKDSKDSSWKWPRKKPSKDTPRSQLLISQRQSLIENFERSLLMSTQEVSRTNPLANS